MTSLIPGKLYVIKLVSTSRIETYIVLDNIQISASTSLSAKNNKEFFSELVPLYKPIMFIGIAKLEPRMISEEIDYLLFDSNQYKIIYKIIYKNKILYIPVLDSIYFEDAETFIERGRPC